MSLDYVSFIPIITQKNSLMILKQLMLLGAFLTFTAPAFAQNSVNAAGGNSSSSTGNISYSIGQVFSKAISSGTNSVIEGVHQPFEISTLGVDQNPNISLEMRVYPNPTTATVFLKTGKQTLQNADYQIFDVSGKLISKGRITQTETSIDLSKNASGTYILIVSNSSQKLKTFKIIKN